MGWKVFVAWATGVLSLAPASAQDHPVLIHGARVFDGTRMLGRRDVLLANGRIAALGKMLGAPANAEVIDSRGRTLIPGLIDGHVHVFPGAQSDALRFGVTTMFDMYSVAGAATIEGWRQQRSSYSRVAEADTFTAGIGATPPGGHPTELFAGQADIPMPPTLAAGADSGAFMAARVAGGSDYIKILQDDGARPGRPASLPAFSPARFAAVIRSAKATGKLVVVHVQQLADARVAAAGDVDVIEHAICDALLDPTLVRSIVTKGVAQTATLAVYDGVSGADDARRLAADPAVAPYLSDTQRGMLALVWPRPRFGEFATALANTRTLARAGAVMIAGTDAPNPTTAFGPSLHLELALLVRAGLTPVQALAAATSAPARIFKTPDRGRIAEGMRADLVLVEGDPTKRITDSRRIVTIWKNGYIVDRRPVPAPRRS
ncbi:amidohydrolase family protein [Sphingomonas sp.]|uniref:amidohydrolase family protein n=1 Tax=Sphingomonas sp. TaxID=28214 RepID=UPI003B00DE2F